MKTALCLLTSCVFANTAAAELSVTNIQVAHRNGQTFVTWKDVAEGDAGADYRYSLYCSERPITEANLGSLKPVISRRQHRPRQRAT